MSDENLEVEKDRIPEINFEEDGDVEIVRGDGSASDPDIDLPDQYRNLSKKDLVEMVQKAQAQADAVEAMKTGISELGEKIAKPVPSTEGGAGETPKVKTVEEIVNEIDLSDIDQSFFEEKGPSAGIKRALAAALPKVVANIQAQVPTNTGSSDTRKIELMMDEKEGDTFKKFRKEVEVAHAALPENLKGNPQSWDYVYGQVKLQHMEDIVAERVQKELEGKASAGKERKVSFSENAGTSVSRPGTQKRQVRLTDEEIREMETMERRGIPRNVYLKRKMEGSKR